jgi:hypothetical protein
MRENVVRDIVTRMLTDGDFLKSVRETPGKALFGYGLSPDELAAISSNDDGALGIGRLESRISAATLKPPPTTGGQRVPGEPPPPPCGCINVSPSKCSANS